MKEIIYKIIPIVIINIVTVIIILLEEKRHFKKMDEIYHRHFNKMNELYYDYGDYGDIVDK